jgi:hypothetical protein
VSHKLYPTADGQQKEAPELTALDVLALPPELRLPLELDLKARIKRNAAAPSVHEVRPGQLKEAIDRHFAFVCEKWKTGELKFEQVPPVMITTKQWEYTGNEWQENEVTTFLTDVRFLDDGTLELRGF